MWRTYQIRIDATGRTLEVYAPDLPTAFALARAETMTSSALTCLGSRRDQ